MGVDEHSKVSRLDIQTLNDFRDEVNENGMGYQIFRDYEGKYKWGIICSAMDWIAVSLCISTILCSYCHSYLNDIGCKSSPHYFF